MNEAPVTPAALPPRPVAAAPSAPPPGKAGDLARIAKVMARAGLCSRRDAEAWIADGRVAVNGEVLTSPARDVGPADAVVVDGYPIDKPERTRLFLFNKARGLVTTSRDPEGRPTVFDALPPELPRLMTIGRLDINTEGLLLLTNDGGLARLLELPSTGWIRRYRVRAHGDIDQAQLDALSKGLIIDGVAYAGIAAKLDRLQGTNAWLTMGLKEGKNREIKRVLEHLGLGVTRLIRISFGPFQLGELADNAVEEVRTRVLRDQLGSALARQAGVDFDSPLDHERTAAPQAPPPDQPPRRQTRRTATADRRGRAVTVERISTVAPASAARPRSGEPSSRAPGAERLRPPRRSPGAGAPPGPDPARPGRPGASRFRPGEEPARPRRADDAKRSFRASDDRPPRGQQEGRARADRAPARLDRSDQDRAAPGQSRRPDDRKKPWAGPEGPARRPRSATTAEPANRAERRRASSSQAAAPSGEGPPRRARPEREGRPPQGGGPGRGGPGGAGGSGNGRGGRTGGGKGRPRG